MSVLCNLTIKAVCYIASGLCWLFASSFQCVPPLLACISKNPGMCLKVELQRNVDESLFFNSMLYNHNVYSAYIRSYIWWRNYCMNLLFKRVSMQDGKSVGDSLSFFSSLLRLSTVRSKLSARGMLVEELKGSACYKPPIHGTPSDPHRTLSLLRKRFLKWKKLNYENLFFFKRIFSLKK